MVHLKEVGVDKMFWALTAESGKRYTQTVEKSFHLSNAALEVTPESSWSNVIKQNPLVSVMVGVDKAEYLLCTLNHKSLYQQSLDLRFTEGEEITLFINGQGVVHLSGYFEEDQMEDGMELPSDFEDEDESEDDEDSDPDEAPQLVSGIGKKRKREEKDSLAKKIQWLPDDEDSEDDSDDEDFEVDDEDIDEDDDDEDDDVELEFDEDDDDDDDDEEVEEPPKKKKQKNGEKESGKKENTPAGKDKKEPVQDKKSEPEGEKKKKKKKKKKKQNSETSNDQDDNKKNTKSPAVSSAGPKKRVLQGGTVLEELSIGSGDVAKKGKMVHVYYRGTLEKSGKQFDSCTGGTPFRFRLGKSEVIAGWETGVEGMKVGGKRRLTVPPQQGYGNTRQGPIPPGSTLVFEIELKKVS